MNSSCPMGKQSRGCNRDGLLMSTLIIAQQYLLLLDFGEIFDDNLSKQDFLLTDIGSPLFKRHDRNSSFKQMYAGIKQ